jgi:hypothetical protein
VTTGVHILRHFCGPWILRREIEPGGAHLHGDAVFAPVGEGALAYRESGILTLADGREFSAYRQYRYCLSHDRIVVEFADGPDIGKQFLSLSFSRTDRGLEASDVHTCGDDTYHATYKIPGPASFEVIIMVRGPAKAYELVSRYSRVSVNGPIKGSSQKIMV